MSPLETWLATAFLAFAVILLVHRWRLPATLARRYPDKQDYLQQSMLAPWLIWNSLGIALIASTFAVRTRDNFIAAAIFTVAGVVWVATAWVVRWQRRRLGLDAAGEDEIPGAARRRYPARYFGIPGAMLLVAPQFVR